LVASLIEKSLLALQPNAGDEPRYTMLETVREFALECLAASGEADATREAHAAWCVALAQEAGPRVMGADQVRWLDRLHREHDNLRAALAWSLQRGDEETTLALAGALWMFWHMHGHVTEGRRWLDQALSLGADVPSLARIQALLGAGRLAHDHGDTVRASACFDRSLALSRELGDVRGTAFSLFGLGMIAAGRGDYDTATGLQEEARRLFASLADLPSMALATYHLAVAAYGQGDLARADALCEEALRPARAADDAFTIAATLYHLGLVAGDRGDVARGAAALTEGLPLVTASGNLPGIARCLANVAVLATGRRRWQDAARLLGAVATLQEMLGYGFHEPEAPRYERAEQETRAALKADFAGQWAAGKAWTIAEAIAEATRLGSVLSADNPPPVEPRPAGLTPRELEVLRLVALGHSDREITDACFISRYTVTKHVANILGKLGVGSRTAAAALAHRDGLI
jgi:non-specific serine/threonine protein kinase